MAAGDIIARGRATVTGVSDGYTVLMSVPSASVPCNSDGSNPVLTAAKTNIRIYKGATLLSFSITSIDKNPADVTCTQTTGSLTLHTVTITAIPTVSTMTGWLRINFQVADGYTSYVDFAFAKQKQGVQGDPGKDAYALILSNENQSIGFDAAGNALSGELGVSGKAKTLVSAYKGTLALTLTTGTPVTGQYKIVSTTCISGTAVAAISGNSVYISSLTTDTAVIRIAVLLENLVTLTKDFTIQKIKKHDLNLLNWLEEWTLGNGVISGWANNGTTAENSRVMGANPFGIQSMLWKCVPDATTTDNGGAAGGWSTSDKVLDKNYAYRYCVFVYKNKTGGTTYHGCLAVNNLDGTANVNPYFWNGNITPGQWYLMVGIIHPSSVTAQSGISGVYDMQGKKIADGTDFKFRTDTTNPALRAFLYYSYDTTVNQWFYNPMLHRLDGTEPGIEQLLQLSVRKTVDSSFQVLNDTITSKVTETKTYADNAVAALQVGGRNLIRNSDFSNGLTNWSSGGTLAIDTSLIFMGLNPLKYTGTSNATGYLNLYQQMFSLLKPNTDYVLSCYAKYSGNQAGMFGLFLEGNKATYDSLPTGTVDWKKYTLKFTTGATLTDQRVGWYFAAAVANTVTVWHTMFKLEEGDKDTDWSPSPDDQKTWVEQNYTTIAQTANNIALEIGKVQVGGRNLIPNSSNIHNITQEYINGSFTHNVADMDGGNNASTALFNVAGGIFRIGQADANSILKMSNNTYTYSIWVYPLVGTQVKIGISAFDPVTFTVVVGKWQRLSVTGTMDEGAWYDSWKFVDFRGINSGDSFKLYHPQVEVGNKATDWSPSPDDIPTKDNILSSINLSQEAIKIKAALIAFEGMITANNNFMIRTDGIAEMKGAIVEGMIKAISGYIGNFAISNGDIVGSDTSLIERIRLTTGAIPALTALASVWEVIAGSQTATSNDTFFRGSRPEEGDIVKTSETYYFSHTFSMASVGYIIIGRADSVVTLGSEGSGLSPTIVDSISIYQGSTLIASGLSSDDQVYIGVTGTLTCSISTTVSIDNMPYDKNIPLVITQGWDSIFKQKSSEKTMIGSNGFYSMFDASKFIYFNKDYGFDVQFGNSRLRLTTSGIQKSSNGGTSWTSL